MWSTCAISLLLDLSLTSYLKERIDMMCYVGRIVAKGWSSCLLAFLLLGIKNRRETLTLKDMCLSTRLMGNMSSVAGVMYVDVPEIANGYG